jgi:hypothetical protein
MKTCKDCFKREALYLSVKSEDTGKEMIEKVITRLWFYEYLHGYVLTEDDILALRRCTQASTVYSISPIDFLGLTVAQTRLEIRDEIRPSLKALRSYSSRIQQATDNVDSVLAISTERRAIAQSPQLFSWIYAIEDGFIVEDMDLCLIMQERPDLLAYLLSTYQLAIEDNHPDALACIFVCWRRDVQDSHLVSPRLLWIAGLRDIDWDTATQAYLTTLNTPEKILEAHEQILISENYYISPDENELLEPTLDRVGHN